MHINFRCKMIFSQKILRNTEVVIKIYWKLLNFGHIFHKNACQLFFIHSSIAHAKRRCHLRQDCLCQPRELVLRTYQKLEKVHKRTTCQNWPMNENWTQTEQWIGSRSKYTVDPVQRIYQIKQQQVLIDKQCSILTV